MSQSAIKLDGLRYLDYPINTTNLTWKNRPTGEYTATLPLSTYFGGIELVMTHVIGYSGVPIYTIKDGRNVVLVKQTNTDAGNVTIRGFFWAS